MRITRASWGLSAAALAALLAACGGSGGGAGTGGAGTDEPPFTVPPPVYDVQYTPETVVVEESALLSGDSSSGTYTFSESALSAAGQQLAAGQVLLVAGRDLRRIDSVGGASGGEVVVQTSEATLNEAIQDGTIEWVQPIRFDPGTGAPTLHLLTSEGRVPFRETSSNTLEAKVNTGPYAITVSIEMNGATARVALTVEKSVGGGVKARFKAEGTLQQFKSANRITYAGGQLQEFSHQNQDLRGELDLSITLAGSGNDALQGFEFPAVLLEYPMLVGPIPVVLSVKALFVINCVVPLEGSAEVSAKFTFDSATGIHYGGTSVEVNGAAGTHQVVKNVAQTGAASAISVNYGIAFPRIEVGLLGKSIVPWAQTSFLIGGFYQPGVHACQEAKSSFIGAVGYDLSFLGLVDLGSGSKTLWQQDQVLLQVGSCT